MDHINGKFKILFLMACGFFSWLPNNGVAYYIRGALDTCYLDQGHYCYAWACAPESPDRMIVLRLSFDRKLMVTVLGNIEREESVKKECGNNRYRGAFFEFDREIIDYVSDGNLHEIFLEALDPETNRYVSIESRMIRGNPAKPVVFFQQPPNQGIIINSNNINDINNLPKGIFGVVNWDGANPVVAFNEMTHIYLDSKKHQCSNPDASFLRSTPFYVFPDKINPWTLGRRLSVSVSSGFNSAERWKGGEVYLVMYTLWSDDDGHKFWLGWQLFDLRAINEFVAMDDCRTCTGWPIVAGQADGGIYGHPAMDSARFMSFPRDSGPERFTILVTWENFINAVNAVQRMQGVAGYSDDPLRYKLESILLNPEVYIGIPEAGGLLDVQFFGFSIGVQ